MSTIIKASGVKFTNPNLPIITPLIGNGLVAAFRPTAGAMGLVDLSGNGHTLTTIGNPEFTQYGVKGDRDNGFLTDVLDSHDLTLIAVSRAKKAPTADSISGFSVGNYKQADGIGACMFRIGTVENGVVSSVKLQSQAYALATDTQTQRSAVRTVRTYSSSELANSTTTNWDFVALVLNTANNTQSAYLPSIQKTPVDTYNHTTVERLLSGRNLNRPDGTPNYFRIIASEDTGSWPAEMEVAEVLIFNKALSADEIMQQYEYSKSALSKKGISI